MFPSLGAFIFWMWWPYLVAVMTHVMFGRTRALPPAREIAAKTRAIMNPVSPKKGRIMDTENTTQKKFTAQDAANLAVFIGVATFSFIAASKLAGIVTEKAVDAVINTVTLARKPKTSPEVHNVTDLA
jgi:hypothetical protein